ncbi:MAG: ATP-binding protein [Lachnospiraceae bacterium]|nr:ATP-binding protein [Lachnospiraceae bacterium]
MPITKDQYEAVEELYRERRRRARFLADEKAARIRQELPELEQLEQQRLSLSMDRIRSAFGGDPEKAALVKEKMRRISREKESLLRTKGYTPADLEPVYTCPLCRDTGRFEGRECRCFAETLEEAVGRTPLSREPEARFEDFSLSWYDDAEPLRAFGGLTARRVMENVLAAAEEYADRFSEKRGGLFLTGPVGTGKTFLGRCIARAVAAQGYETCLVTAQEFFGAAEALAFDKENGDPLLIEQMNRAQLLVIDDLGTEFTSRRLAQNALFTMINEREIRELGTILTGNITLEEMEDLYTNRVTSRIAGSYRILPFTGPDIRLAKKQAGKP